MPGTARTQVAEMGSTAPNMSRLRDIIEEKSFLSGKAFKLSSGKPSTVFFNLKQTMLHPEGAGLLTEAVLRILERENVGHVGGLEMGAVPLVSQLCLMSHGRFPLKTFFVRKEPKKHGAMGLIDGYLNDGADVIVLDDVVTTGGSVLKAADAVRDRGCRVSKAITIVDRLEGGKETLLSQGLELVSLFDRNDFPA